MTEIQVGHQVVDHVSTNGHQEAAVPLWNLDDPALYLNRELSWLEFNDRVLAEARDPRNRLLERAKFLAITSSNLDEFYAKRVGWLRRSLRSDPRMRTVDGLTVAEQLPVVLQRCARMCREIEQCWHEELAPALREYGISIFRFDDLDDDARASIRDYFEQSIFPVLTPLVVDPAHPFPFISSQSLSIGFGIPASAHGPDPLRPRSRFRRIAPALSTPGTTALSHLKTSSRRIDLPLPGMHIDDWQVFRVIRSAEIGSPGEEADDLLELIESELRRRRLAEAVSLHIAGEMPRPRLDLLLEELELTDDDVVVTEGPLDMADLFQIAMLSIPGESDEPFTPAIPSPFFGVSDPETFFAGIRERDILVHHPYESFDSTVARFIDEAAADPAVLAIKQTMYRTSPDSPILASVIDAAGRGKQVAVLVELTARFDEANNIEWARKLEDAGVHVAYGNPDQKIHSKISLVVREEASRLTMYGHIGTGNYNSRTARLYTDLGLFTSDPGICGDLLRIFNYLTGFADDLHSDNLLVAPANLRDGLRRRIFREIANARAGKPAWITLKMNALEDREFTELLYRASQAGVRCDLVIRGICRLRPGLPGLSENIRVVSIMGRFLEHSRIFAFCNDGDPEYFIGSADIMKRNLDGRIEVVTPVQRPELKAQLQEALEIMLADQRQLGAPRHHLAP
ncbi:MAG: polyphosphate kinase 1 [Dehalococcoidia bacterium]|nr:polyphosphate kinase 1 [Dehalococcoidia bacterium]